MPLSHKGALYEGRDAIANSPLDTKALARHLVRALDDLASQNQAIRNQGNFGLKSAPEPPHPITAIAVVASAGFATVTLTHNNAPAGTRYQIQYSTTPNFLNPVQVDNGISLSMMQYLKGQTLYFRAAPMLPTSALAPWVYLGGQTTPTAVTF